jgi:hypothetical protein
VTTAQGQRPSIIAVYNSIEAAEAAIKRLADSGS